MAAIYFFNEDINFSLKNKNRIKAWIKKIILSEGGILKDVNFIFSSDTYLHQLNLQYLNHDDFTDIITFDKAEQDGDVSGDIFISIDRIKDNAALHDQEFEQELKRVIIHGILHLLNYKDKGISEKQIMVNKENEALALWNEIDVPRGTSRV